MLRRALLPVLAVAAGVAAAALCPAALTAQDRDTTARRPAPGTAPAAVDDSAARAARRAEMLARADSARASLVQPPPRPPRGFGEVVDKGLKFALAPVWLVMTGLVELADLAAGVVSSERAGAVASDVEGAGLDVGVGSIGPRSGEAIQLKLTRFRPLYVEGAYSLRDFRRLGAGLELGDPDERGIRVGYRYTFHAEPHFWGIGPDTEDSFESDFLWERHLATVEGGLPLGTNLRLDAVAGWEDNRVAEGEDVGKPDVLDTFDPSEVFGLADQTQLVRAGASLTWDRRTWREIQRRGFLLRFGTTAWEGVAGTDTDRTGAGPVAS